jgi:hypothetical protein
LTPGEQKAVARVAKRLGLMHFPKPKNLLKNLKGRLLKDIDAEIKAAHTSPIRRYELMSERFQVQRHTLTMIWRLGQEAKRLGL